MDVVITYYKLCGLKQNRIIIYLEVRSEVQNCIKIKE